MVDKLVVNALRKAIERDTEFRLVGVGTASDEPGLFTARPGAPKKAILASTTGDDPLLKVRDEEGKVKGKGKTSNQLARITNTGISTLVGHVPLREFPQLIAASAPLLRARVLRSCLRSLALRSNELDPSNHRRLVNACLKIAQTEFEVIESRFQEIVQEEQLLSETIAELLKTTCARIEKQKVKLTSGLESIAKAVGALVSPAELAPEDQTKRPRLPAWQRVPTSDVEIDFQRSLSEELVFAWQDTASPDARAVLERAMLNVGVERLNAPGDVVGFDADSHHTDDDVNQGDPVEVILPGWQLVNPRGTSLLARAKVNKTNRSTAPTATAADAKVSNGNRAATETPAGPRIDRQASEIPQV